MLENNAFPCNFCIDAEMSGTKLGGDCMIEVSGLKSITKRAISDGFFLGTI